MIGVQYLCPLASCTSTLTDNGFPLIDVTSLFEARSESGLVDYEFLDDEVHPNRPSQFVLGTEILKTIVDLELLPAKDYKARHASIMLPFDAVVKALDEIESQNNA